MKIKHGMILAAGLGKRMQPLTNKKPKPLLEIKGSTLLERAINLLINHGVEEIIVNIHHLAYQIEKFISNFKSEVKIKISNEKDLLLDTGGGVKKGTKEFEDNPFFVINPDTLWSNKYSEEVQSLEKEYSINKRPCLLLVKKELSLDNSFKGDFNLNNKLISKDEQNQFIFTGLQIMKNDHLAFTNKNIFSMNEVWTKLISENNLGGLESNQKFYHLNTLEMFEKISSLRSID
ncbi:MAG: nucleotidyltransferase family protein [Pseudomonadota bacterium]|nr:nucleotidyltransferase family protein [Pseudomonadota bacterium]